MVNKICCRCRKEKKKTEFNKNRSCKDGLACECRACRSTDYQRTAKNKGKNKVDEEEYASFITSGVSSAKKKKEAIDKAGINNGIIVPYNLNTTSYDDVMSMIENIIKSRRKRRSKK